MRRSLAPYHAIGAFVVVVAALLWRKLWELIMPHNFKGNPWVLVVISGPMFSRKTTRMVEAIASLNSPNGLVLKHSNDQQRSLDTLSSHDQSVNQRVPATPIQSLYQVMEYLLPTTTNVFIDEIQFFRVEEVVKFIDLMKQHHPTIHLMVCGLDQDFRGEDFPTTGAFEKLASEVVRCTATCASCDQTATMSYFKNHATQEVKVGGAKLFEPRCAPCHAHGMGMPMG